MNKKLQVFVSSTFKDLIEERQAAVEAILDAGHIPAGMELFKAGNDSQLQTIYKWIDESDVYMLILGGRYGSIEKKSGKSYTQLEYEYALSKDIPVFAVIISQSFLTSKINSIGYDKATEQEYPEKYKNFKNFVMSKIIREVDDCKDIKIAIHATLNEFMNTYNLIGWTRNTYENNNIQLLKDNAILLKENNILRKQIQKLQEPTPKKQFGNYSFDELINLFTQKNFVIPAHIFENDKDTKINALTLYILNYEQFATGVPYYDGCAEKGDKMTYLFFNIAPYFISFQLLEMKDIGRAEHRIRTTKFGSDFYAMLEYKGLTNNLQT